MIWRASPPPPDERPDPRALSREFYCRPRRRRLSLDRCLDDYMMANAFTDKRSACWRCPQGCGNRRTFATGGPT
jgi:hypothetical protein